MMSGLKEQFGYIECSNCHCLQINEIPENMGKFYSEDYYSFDITNNSNFLKKFITNKRDEYCLFKNSLLGKIIKEAYPNYFFSSLGNLKINQNSKILDVGCGAGYFLYQLKKFGFRHLYGIDLYLNKEIKTKNLQILKRSIYELHNDQKFDFIIFSHSFEHMADPYEILMKVKKILSENGRCIIRIPVKTDYIWNLYGINWVQIDAPRHLFIHSQRSFDILLEKTGFILENTIFDSTEFQFWGSEQYKRGIALNSDNSYSINPQKSIFSKKEIKKFKKRAKILNHEKSGDQAIFVLKKV